MPETGGVQPDPARLSHTTVVREDLGMRPGLIVNADDYGFTPAVSAGIRGAHTHGIVSSTTVLIMSPSARADLREALSECPDLGIGVHLALTGGWRPLLGHKVPTLRGRRGRLLSSRDLSDLLSRADPKEVRDEWQAQIAAVIEAGVTPDHLDAHHHIAYRSQRLMEVLFELAAEYALPIRLPVPTVAHAKGGDAVLDMVPPLLSPQLLRDRAHACAVAHPDQLIAGFAGDTGPKALIALIGDLPPDSVSELMCHPGKVDWRLRRTSSYTGKRALELATLTDDSVRQVLEDRSVRLTTFAGA